MKSNGKEKQNLENIVIRKSTWLERSFMIIWVNKARIIPIKPITEPLMFDDILN